jgi:hypothetical protein
MNNLSPTIGKKDIILNFQSKWSIYELDILDKKGLWLKFKEKIKELKEKNIFESITQEDIIKYFDLNSDIEFEQVFFDDTMNKLHLFQIKGKIYSYTSGKKSKRTKRKIYARFYFDLNDIFNY